MSDFDKEAEREKLREKYERDKQKREASERMSELLLQGATMTNRHCSACQSPIFRYDGQEFCPTCEKEVTEDGELRAPESGAESESGGAPEAADADVRSNAATEVGDNEDTEPTADAEPKATDSSTGTDETAEATGSPPTPARESRPARVDPPARREHVDADQPDRAISDLGSEQGTLRETEARLIREIASLAQRAEDTRDVGRKRDLLAAAREAAETLEAVRRL